MGQECPGPSVDRERGSSPRPCRISEIPGELVAKREGIGFIGGARMGGTAHRGGAKRSDQQLPVCLEAFIDQSRDSSSLANGVFDGIAME